MHIIIYMNIWDKNVERVLKEKKKKNCREKTFSLFFLLD